MELKIGNDRRRFYQWDTGRYLLVEGAENCQEVHFCRKQDSTALVCKIREESGVRVANVPNILLQQDGSITAYLFCREADGTQTRFVKTFQVLSRPKPEDYIYTETEVLSYGYLDRRLQYLENEGLANAVNSSVDEAMTRAKQSGDFDGDPGQPGPRGEPGEQGIPGADGKSAYNIAVEQGQYLGTEEEFGIKLATEYIDWFGKGIAIPSGADLNTYKTNGKYYANSESIGKSLLNRPDGMNTNFVMWVFSRTTDSIKSQLMLTLHGKMYIRSSNSNGWRGWEAYTTSGEIETLTEEVKNQLIAELETYALNKVQSDWNQTDPTAVDFLRNKPFGSFETTVVEAHTINIPEEASEFVADLDVSRALEIGKQYKVRYNGVDYITTAYLPKTVAGENHPDGDIVLGNLDAYMEYDIDHTYVNEGNGEPFLIVYTREEMMIGVETAGEHEISVADVSETEQPLPEKYLPASVPKTMQVKPGLTVAIIGDSISTHPGKNACELEITQQDVGVALSAYITYYDIDKTVSLDGGASQYTITADDVGTELSFIPGSADVGKKLGAPKNYNKIENVWWQVAADALGFEPIAATWSGSSVTSHTAASSGKECSYAWHEQTIRKLGKRIPGSMDRYAPDVVLIYRGTNDLSHSQKVRLTSGYFDPVDWKYPDSDLLADGTTYGFKEGLALTVQKIRTTYPKARIVLCTCNVFKRSNYAHFPTHNGYFSIPQMNNAIREVADFFGCHVIELDKCGITWENCYEAGYITDSATSPTHPNAAGHGLMAQQAISDLVHKLHIADVEPSFDLVRFEPKTDGGEDSDEDQQINVATLGTLVENYYINKNTGNLVASDQYYSYTGIPVNSNATYIAPYARNVAYYGADGTRVGGDAKEGASDALITPVAEAVTMTVCYKYLDIPVPADVTITEVLENESGQTRIGDLYGTLMDNHYIDTSDGTLVEYTAEVKYFAYVDIAVAGNTTYSAPYARNTAFYDDDGIYISHVAAGGSSGATITTPANAVFMAVTYQHKNFASPADARITLA